MIRWIRITPQLRECREHGVGGEGLRPPRAELIRVFVCGTWGGVPWDAFTLPSFSLISQQRNAVPREYRLPGKSAACAAPCTLHPTASILSTYFHDVTAFTRKPTQVSIQQFVNRFEHKSVLCFMYTNKICCYFYSVWFKNQ